VTGGRFFKEIFDKGNKSLVLIYFVTFLKFFINIYEIKRSINYCNIRKTKIRQKTFLTFVIFLNDVFYKYTL